MLTHQEFAIDLAAFRRFLAGDEASYKNFPRRKPLRLTYRYQS